MKIYVLYDILDRYPVNPFKVAGFSYKYDYRKHVVTIDEGQEKKTFYGCRLLK